MKLSLSGVTARKCSKALQNSEYFARTRLERSPSASAQFSIISIQLRPIGNFLLVTNLNFQFEDKPQIAPPYKGYELETCSAHRSFWQGFCLTHTQGSNIMGAFCLSGEKATPEETSS